MKIIHIVENLDTSYGGPAKSIPLLIKYLNKLNIENKILTIELNKNEKNDLIVKNNLDMDKFPLLGPKKIKYSKYLKDNIEKNISKDTIIHLHSLWNYPAYIAYKLSKKHNVPLIVSTRGTMFEWALKQRKYIKKLAFWLFQKSMLLDADSLHVTAKEEINAIRKLGINNHFTLVPNGIELEIPYSNINLELLKKFNYSSEKKYIMFLGRIVHNKGIDYLINSYKKVKINYPEVEILIVGGIEEKNYFNSLEKLDGIHFLGMLDGLDKHTIFSISSLFVLPSKGENFSMAIAEAMNYKLPVITTTGTPWEILNTENAGWWVELDQANIDQAILEALLLPQKELIRRGENAYEIIKKFEWKLQAIKMQDCYKQILNKSRLNNV